MKQVPAKPLGHEFRRSPVRFSPCSSCPIVPRVILFGNSRVTPRSGLSPNSVWRRYRVGVDDSVEGTALLREGVKKLLKMLIHFTMACTGNVGIPEVDLTCLRELKTVGGTTPHLLRATGMLSLPESCRSRFPSATSSLAHPLPLSLTFLSFATLAVFNALSCFLLTLLTRSFALAPLLLLLPQSFIAMLHNAVEHLHRPPTRSRVLSDALHLRYVFW